LLRTGFAYIEIDDALVEEAGFVDNEEDNGARGAERVQVREPQREIVEQLLIRQICMKCALPISGHRS
jgi:hypothetical protein